MQEIARKRMNIKVASMDMLNAQIQMEAKASATYLAMASWCEQNAFGNSSHFFYAQANEEREHMMKIFKFINDCGGNAISPEVTNINHDYGTLEEVFETALEHEIDVTKSIHGIMRQAKQSEDFAVEQFMQWFVTEQIEEERTMRDILDLFDLMGREGMALKLIDERIKTD